VFVHIEQRILAFEDKELCPYRTAFIQRPRSQITIKKYYRRSPDCFFVQFCMMQMDIGVWADMGCF